MDKVQKYSSFKIEIIAYAIIHAQVKFTLCLRILGAILSLPKYIFMVWCLVKHRYNFNFTFTFTLTKYHAVKTYEGVDCSWHFNLGTR
jgi:hypothetical protein